MYVTIVNPESPALYAGTGLLDTKILRLRLVLHLHRNLIIE